jgi:hypothetical protein
MNRPPRCWRGQACPRAGSDAVIASRGWTGALRDDVGEVLSQKAVQLEEQRSRLGGEAASGHGRGSAMKGRKVPIKYRDKEGNTWAGRGAQPVWLREKLKAGDKLEDFAVQKTAGFRKAPEKNKEAPTQKVRFIRLLPGREATPSASGQLFRSRARKGVAFEVNCHATQKGALIRCCRRTSPPRGASFDIQKLACVAAASHRAARRRLVRRHPALFS